MPLRYEQFITRKMLQASPETTFVFGDNLLEQGYGGQAAEMRGEPNAFGIPTKKLPDMDPGAFFSDDDFLAIVPIYDTKFLQLRYKLVNGQTVVWPKLSIGSGRAHLQQKAPVIHSYMSIQLTLLQMVGIHGAQAGI